jgi:hypothetical protein
MTNQEIVQVLSVHGEVQAIFVDREATSNQLIAQCLGLGDLGENEFLDWKILVLPRDYHSGIQGIKIFILCIFPNYNILHLL